MANRRPRRPEARVRYERARRLLAGQMREEAMLPTHTVDDPERLRQVLRETRGALQGLDAESFIAQMHQARQQASPGRPA